MGTRHLHWKPAGLWVQQQRQKHSDPSSCPPQSLPPWVQEQLHLEGSGPGQAASVAAVVVSAEADAERASPSNAAAQSMGRSVRPGDAG